MPSSRQIGSWVELSSALNRDNLEITASRVSPAALGGLLARIVDATISGKIAKDVFEAMWGRKPERGRHHREAGPEANHGPPAPSRASSTPSSPPIRNSCRLSGRQRQALPLLCRPWSMKATEGKANPAQLNDL